MLVLSTVSFRLPRRWARRGLMITFFLLTAHSSLLTVQGQKPDPVDTIRIDTDLVNLNVSVVNRRASLATGHLEQKDFAVFENGAPQEVSFFASGETPLISSCCWIFPAQPRIKSV